MAKLQRSTLFEDGQYKDPKWLHRKQLWHFANRALGASVLSPTLHYTFQAATLEQRAAFVSLPEIVRDALDALLRKLQLHVAWTNRSRAIHLIPEGTEPKDITEDDARTVMVAHDLFAAGGVGKEHWMSLTFYNARPMPIHPRSPGYDLKFVGREDLWFVSRQNISPAKLVQTARYYEPKVAEQLSSTHLLTQTRHVLESMYSHCSNDSNQLALAESFLLHVLFVYGKGCITLDAVKHEMHRVNAPRYERKSREELVDNVGRIPTAHGLGDSKRAKSSIPQRHAAGQRQLLIRLPGNDFATRDARTGKLQGQSVVRQRDARAPPNFTLGQRGTHHPLLQLWLELAGADGDTALWFAYAAFMECAKKEQYEALLRRIRRVLDGILVGFKLHPRNKLSKALHLADTELKALEAQLKRRKEEYKEAERNGSGQLAHALRNFRACVEKVAIARTAVRLAQRDIQAMRNQKAKEAMEDAATLVFPDRDEHAEFLDAERITIEKQHLEGYARKNFLPSMDWSKFYDEHVEGGAQPELRGLSVAQVVDPREAWERVAGTADAPGVDERRRAFKEKNRDMHIAQCRVGELVFPDFDANFPRIKADLLKRGVDCGELSEEGRDAMRQNAERRAAAVERAGAEDDIAMLDDDESDDPAPAHDSEDDEEGAFSGHPSEMPSLRGAQPPTREALNSLGIGMPPPVDGDSDVEVDDVEHDEVAFEAPGYVAMQVQLAQQAASSGPPMGAKR